MKDFIIVAVLVVIVGIAVAYLVKAKKSGVKCVGCPSEGTCASKNNGESSCNCGCSTDK